MQLSNKAYAVLSAWSICTAIQLSAFAGWLVFPSSTAEKVYLIAWVVCTTFCAGPWVRASKLLFCILFSIGLIGIAHAMYLPDSSVIANQAAVFLAITLTVILSTNWFTQVLQSNIEIWYNNEGLDIKSVENLSTYLDTESTAKDVAWYDRKSKRNRRGYYFHQTIHGNNRQ